jgi:acyl-CoA thioester hydrolase
VARADALEIHPQGQDDLRASGDVVWVNTDQSTHRSSPVPAALVELVNAYERKE